MVGLHLLLRWWEEMSCDWRKLWTSIGKKQTANHSLHILHCYRYWRDFISNILYVLKESNIIRGSRICFWKIIPVISPYQDILYHQIISTISGKNMQITASWKSLLLCTLYLPNLNQRRGENRNYYYSVIMHAKLLWNSSNSLRISSY